MDGSVPSYGALEQIAIFSKLSTEAGLINEKIWCFVGYQAAGVSLDILNIGKQIRLHEPRTKKKTWLQHIACFEHKDVLFQHEAARSILKSNSGLIKFLIWDFDENNLMVTKFIHFEKQEQSETMSF